MTKHKTVETWEDSLSQLAATCGQNKFEVRPARDFDELRECLQLVYNQYEPLGLCDAHPDGILVSAAHLLPESVTFVAKHGDSLIGTLVLFDPSAVSYRQELSRFISPRRRACEGSMLAFDTSYGRHSVDALLYLLSYALNWCVRNDIDDLFMCVTPKHASFYQSFGSALPVGIMTKCPGTISQRGILLRMDIAAVRTGVKPLPRTLASKVMKYAQERHLPLPYHLCNEEIEQLWVWLQHSKKPQQEVDLKMIEECYPYAAEILHLHEAHHTEEMKEFSADSAAAPSTHSTECPFETGFTVP